MIHSLNTTSSTWRVPGHEFRMLHMIHVILRSVAITIDVTGLVLNSVPKSQQQQFQVIDITLLRHWRRDA